LLYDTLFRLYNFIAMNNLFFAQKAFIVDEGCILSVQKSMDDPFNPGKWEVPGGRIKEAEVPYDHIIREVREEVGIDVIPGMPFYVWSWENRKEGVVYKTVALARICRAMGREIRSDFQVEDDYIGDIKWIEIDRIWEYPWIENMMPVLLMFEKIMNSGDEQFYSIFY